ncbi:MAG TPA: TonB-dependent receptor plug domain-containing protein, partial [Cyclobacteriaceae bacterium]|nr:TonB-dependent receptor plug domain-containing protein [Cyclobacteriaceae bacterium]
TDTLSAGTYWLRAYTNLNRNFDKDYFVKPIPILGKTEQVVASEIFIEPTQKHAVTVRLDQRSYGTRDSIGLILSVRDTLGKPLLSNLSVSVTDARQVLPVKPPFTILDKYPFRSEPDHRIIDEVAFPVEYGVSYEGQYLNRRGKPEKATLSILQGNYEHLSVIETDENGLFVETGLQFYDSTDFRFQTKNTKKKYDGRVEIVAREIPALDSQLPSFDLKTINTGKNQRLISEYEVPRGARLLSEILIQGQREDMEKIRPYGKPDFVVNADDLDISSNNLLIILQGKVPGIVISYLSDDSGTHPVVRIARASGLTIKAQTEPMVMIDNVPMSGRAGDILQSINAYTVESIEVVTRVSPAYGSAGVNGVISIYTKRGVGSNYKPIDRSLQTVKMRGYARPDLFRYPNYSNQDSEKNQIDYRSILYWNPFVATDETGIAKVSFYSGDLETRYRVVVEGITENNQPVRGVGYITIENDKQ